MIMMNTICARDGHCAGQFDHSYGSGSVSEFAERVRAARPADGGFRRADRAFGLSGIPVPRKSVLERVESHRNAQLASRKPQLADLETLLCRPTKGKTEPMKPSNCDPQGPSGE